MFRPKRPLIHFTPVSGWINDPNGLVYENGNYHLFAQYYPDATKWGPMHWYHAVSRDLIHWKHLPVALKPDDLGYIYSGSAVFDSENSSGFGVAGKPPIVAIYTNHGKTEQQSIARSTDYTEFIPFTSNPVIPNDTLPDFRDPKIFRKPEGDWGLVLAAGDRVKFYSSTNLTDWKETREFSEQNSASGVWECPDLFPLSCGNRTKWMLTVSMGSGAADRGSRTQYFIGDFKNGKFVSDKPCPDAHWLDAGFDNYASVTFDNTPDKIMLGWASNWIYADKIPAETYRGCMTLPRNITLSETPDGDFIPVLSPVKIGIFSECNYSEFRSLGTTCFCIKVSGRGEGYVTLSNSAGNRLMFGVNGNNEFYFDRTEAGIKDFDDNFASEMFSVATHKRIMSGSWHFELIFDSYICEIFADGGYSAFTSLVFPEIPYNTISCSTGVKARIFKSNSTNL